MSSPNELGVALEALHSDARAWQGAAEDLSAPLKAISRLNVGAEDVSIFAADRGLDRNFNDARTEIENLIRQAGEYFNEIAQDLTSAASQYQHDDEAGQHEIQRSYQMKGDLFDG